MAVSSNLSNRFDQAVGRVNPLKLTNGDWYIDGVAVTASAAQINAGTGTLPDGDIFVGDSSDDPQPRTPGGDLAMDNMGSFAIVPSAVTSTKMNAAVMKVASVVLTAAEIKALKATPKTLVAAPGVNKVIEFVSAVLMLHYVTTPYTESSANLAVKYTDGSGVQLSQDIESTGFIDATESTLTTAEAKINAITAKTGSDNQAIVLHNLGAGEIAAGDSTITVFVTYRVHNATW